MVSLVPYQDLKGPLHHTICEHSQSHFTCVNHCQVVWAKRQTTRQDIGPFLFQRLALRFRGDPSNPTFYKNSQRTGHFPHRFPPKIQKSIVFGAAPNMDPRSSNP